MNLIMKEEKALLIKTESGSSNKSSTTSKENLMKLKINFWEETVISEILSKPLQRKEGKAWWIKIKSNSFNLNYREEFKKQLKIIEPWWRLRGNQSWHWKKSKGWKMRWKDKEEKQWQKCKCTTERFEIWRERIMKWGIEWPANKMNFRRLKCMRNNLRDRAKT